MKSYFAPPLTGQHVLILFLAFFGVILSVNGVLVYRSLSTWTGLEQENAYVDGLNYNQTLEARRAQAELGWRHTLSAEFQNDGGVILTVHFVDRDGAPLEGLNVTAMLRRPTQDGFDQSLELPSRGKGAYGARAVLPLAGQWQVRVTARRGAADLFVSESRIRTR